MFIAIDKLTNQGLKQAIIVLPEGSIGAKFHDEPLSRYGFWDDWRVEPRRPGAMDDGWRFNELDKHDQARQTLPRAW